jgi:hypothetical protein
MASIDELLAELERTATAKKEKGGYANTTDSVKRAAGLTARAAGPAATGAAIGAALGAPLAGVRIADFTIHAAGPFCTHLLSQLGAQCIKVESSTRPDAFRKPHAVYGRMQAATFDQVSANKLSVRLNLKKPEGVELAKRLVVVSDVAAESFRPGVMQRLGLGFEALREVKPDVVLLSLSSCGQTGPDSHFTGYAPLFGAWGGLGWMSGYPDGPPVEMRHVMDHSSGLHAAMALIGALMPSSRCRIRGTLPAPRPNTSTLPGGRCAMPVRANTTCHTRCRLPKLWLA